MSTDRFVVLPLTRSRGLHGSRQAAIDNAHGKIDRNQTKLSIRTSGTAYVVAKVVATVRPKNNTTEIEIEEEAS